MVHMIAGPLVARQNFGNALHVAEQLHHALSRAGIRIADEHVRELVVDQGPGATGRQVQVLAVRFLADLQQSRLAQDTVGIRDVRDGRNHVFAGGDPDRFRITVRRRQTVGQRADDGVQFRDRRLRGRAVRPGALGGVFQVRQVQIEEVRAKSACGVDRRPGDPLGGLDVGQRPPEMLQRKMPKLIPQFAVQLARLGVAPQLLGAVRMVDGRRHADVIRAAAFAEHRKPDGRGPAGTC